MCKTTMLYSECVFVGWGVNQLRPFQWKIVLRLLALLIYKGKQASILMGSKGR